MKNSANISVENQVAATAKRTRKPRTKKAEATPQEQPEATA